MEYLEFFAEHQVHTDILLAHQCLKIAILNTLELTCQKLLFHVLAQEFGMRYSKKTKKLSRKILIGRLKMYIT